MEFKLILGYRCNLKCSYCYQLKEHCNDKEMSYEIIDTFLERYNKLKGSHTINFFGGEPLLYADKIKYIMDRVDKDRTSLSISTNGSLRGTFYELQEYWGKMIGNLLSNKEHGDFTKLNEASTFRYIVTKENIEALTDDKVMFLANHYKKKLQFKYDMSSKWKLEHIQKMEHVQRILQSILGSDFHIELPVDYNSKFVCFVSGTNCFINYNGDYLACHRNPNSKLGNIMEEDFIYCKNEYCLDRCTNRPENLYSYGKYEFKGVTLFHSCD